MPSRPICREALGLSLGNWLISIVLLVPGAVLLKVFHAHPVAVFLAAALALVPLASLLGDATEELSGYLGPALPAIRPQVYTTARHGIGHTEPSPCSLGLSPSPGGRIPLGASIAL